MKHTLNLTLAITAAIGLSACGGSNNDMTHSQHPQTQHPQTQQPQTQQPQTQQPSANTSTTNFTKYVTHDSQDGFNFNDTVTAGNTVILQGRSDKHANVDLSSVLTKKGYQKNNVIYSYKEGNKAVKENLELFSYLNDYSFVTLAKSQVSKDKVGSLHNGVPVQQLPVTGLVNYKGSSFDDKGHNGNFAYTVDFAKKAGYGTVQSPSYGNFLLRPADLKGNKFSGDVKSSQAGSYEYEAYLYGKNAEEIVGFIEKDSTHHDDAPIVGFAGKQAK